MAVAAAMSFRCGIWNTHARAGTLSVVLAATDMNGISADIA